MWRTPPVLAASQLNKIGGSNIARYLDRWAGGPHTVAAERGTHAATIHAHVNANKKNAFQMNQHIASKKHEANAGAAGAQTGVTAVAFFLSVKASDSMA